MLASVSSALELAPANKLAVNVQTLANSRGIMQLCVCVCWWKHASLAPASWGKVKTFVHFWIYFPSPLVRINLLGSLHPLDISRVSMWGHRRHGCMVSPWLLGGVVKYTALAPAYSWSRCLARTHGYVLRSTLFVYVCFGILEASFKDRCLPLAPLNTARTKFDPPKNETVFFAGCSCDCKTHQSAVTQRIHSSAFVMDGSGSSVGVC